MTENIKGAPLAQAKTNGKARPQSVTVQIVVDGQAIATSPAILRTFSSGKSGYGVYGKTMLPNGEQLQMSVNLVIPHSEAK